MICCSSSHALKEPVRKIKTFANRLKDESADWLTEKSKTFLDKVLSSAERMSIMIEGVLAYSTINASEKVVEPVDLNNVLTDIKNDLEVVIQYKQATVEHDPLPHIQGSRFLLYQLFYNLLNNSLKFSRPDERPQISVRSSTMSWNGNSYVEIVLKDNGIGFDAMHAEHIFDTFARLNPKDKYEGTGLGLALCKKIVQRHSGTIEAKGEKGIGASFIIRLPVKQRKNSTTNTSKEYEKEVFAR
jgi:light-regulated signal transduction histidine kinase (bacteriophytochrome)